MIIDIDNCIVDSRPLDKYTPKDLYSREGWDEYQKHYDEALPNPFVIGMVQYYSHVRHITPIFITAREDRNNCRKQTENLLRPFFGDNYLLYMRTNDNFDTDVEVKNELYERIICRLNPKKIVFAIDDKPEICELWKSKGIQTICYSLPKIVT